MSRLKEKKKKKKKYRGKTMNEKKKRIRTVSRADKKIYDKVTKVYKAK